MEMNIYDLIRNKKEEKDSSGEYKTKNKICSSFSNISSSVVQKL